MTEYIKKISKRIIYFMLLLAILPHPGIACRYTVREIGFTDLGALPYRFYIYTDSTVHDTVINTLKSLAYLSFMDANLETSIISSQDPSPGRSLPSAMLVSPSGRQIPVPIEVRHGNFQENVLESFNYIVRSPLREKMLEETISGLAVVLLIEGTRESGNRQAEQTINDAIGEAEKMMGHLPKKVQKAPVMIRIPRSAFDEEKHLLFSLGYDPEQMEKPAAAVIYGRGRIMGELLYDRDIQEIYLYNLISIVGADCECSLENHWKIGRMLLVQWNEGHQEKLAGLLGFDVGSPFVKAEMAQILSINFQDLRQEAVRWNEEGEAGEFVEKIRHQKLDLNALLGYKEEVMVIEKPSDVPRMNALQIRQSMDHGKNGNGLIIVLVAGGITLLVAAAGLWIWFRKKR